jgi:acyl-coenzyme A thioesterase PaaI-like protein
MVAEQSLQEKFAPQSICFGCGPANKKGLRIRSMPSGNDEVVCDWTPEEHHQAFPGMINGGIIGSLLDCHSNWTAAYQLMKKQGLSEPPCTVTAEYTVKLLRPTPTGVTLTMKARAVEFPGDDRAWIEAELIANDKVCAKCRGLFVAVKPGHPAYHRWG